MQRTHFTAGYTLYNCVCNKTKNIYTNFLLQYRYPIMEKCLNIEKNIGKTIYRSISKKKSGPKSGRLKLTQKLCSLLADLLETSALSSDRSVKHLIAAFMQRHNQQPRRFPLTTRKHTETPDQLSNSTESK